MKHRKLRIAWSVAWGIAAVLLVVLWVRSYWWMDVIHCPTSHPILAHTFRGVAQINIMPNDIGTGWKAGWGMNNISATSLFASKLPTMQRWYLNWPKTTSVNDFPVVSFPFWIIAMPLTLGAVAPWIRHLHWHFTLRTLLIATTLVAIGLGLIVWLTR